VSESSRNPLVRLLAFGLALAAAPVAGILAAVRRGFEEARAPEDQGTTPQLPEGKPPGTDDDNT